MGEGVAPEVIPRVCGVPLTWRSIQTSEIQFAFPILFIKEFIFMPTLKLRLFVSNFQLSSFSWKGKTCGETGIAFLPDHSGPE